MIGVTGYGGTHLKALKALGERGAVRIRAAAVINREEAEEICQALEAEGCTIYPDYESLLTGERGKLDLCCIPTGIAWHCRMTVDALRAGCHVLVEKPVAGTVAEVDEMIRTRNETGKQVFVGFQDLFLEQMVALKQSILSGDYGALESIRIWASWPRTSAYYGRNNWAGRLRNEAGWIYDSPANNALSHYLMAGLFLAGRELDTAASPVQMEAELYRAQAIESFDTMSAWFARDDGVRLFYAVTHSGNENIGPRVELRFREGQVVWQGGKLSVNREGGAAQEIPMSADACSRERMMDVVVRSIVAGKTLGGCSLEMAREHTRLINALHDYVAITPVAGQYLERHESGGVVQTSIRDIIPAVQRCADEGKLLSECGVPWAGRPTRVELSAGEVALPS